MYLIQPIHRAGCSTGKKSTNLPSYTLTTEGARGEEPHSWRSDTMAEDAAAHQLVESEAAQRQPHTPGRTPPYGGALPSLDLSRARIYIRNDHEETSVRE